MKLKIVALWSKIYFYAFIGKLTFFPCVIEEQLFMPLSVNLPFSLALLWSSRCWYRRVGKVGQVYQQHLGSFIYFFMRPKQVVQVFVKFNAFVVTLNFFITYFAFSLKLSKVFRHEFYLMMKFRTIFNIKWIWCLNSRYTIILTLEKSLFFVIWKSSISFLLGLQPLNFLPNQLF